jgi:GT2 family glycosyltransferase
MIQPDDLDGSIPPPDLDEQDRSAAPAGAPAVVAVVVTRNPGRFFEAALAALADQDYPELSVLVVDAGSSEDPTTRVAAVLPGAFVHRAAGAHPGFGGAANEALGLVAGATLFVACHDDVVLAPDAVRLMVEEAYRSNAAIVGPKLVSANDPEVLLEVGRSIDRLGGSHTGIEPGELDQEQHDAVRDVFYVSSAAMLVRTDLFEALGGFDPETFPGSEDLDLCWRARLAGARVVVAPDARAAHIEAANDRRPGDAPTIRDVARNRVRVVLTNYSRSSLVRVVPAAVALAMVEAIVFAATPRRRQATAVLGAWRWHLMHPRRRRAARRRAQSERTVHDGELRELQVGAGARVGSFLTQHHTDERIESLEDRVRDSLESLGDTLMHPASFALAAFVLVVVFGTRDFFFSGVPGVGSFVSWPGVHALAGAFGSPWRYTGLGSTAAPPPALAIMAGLGTILVGSVGLAQTLLVALAIPVGAVGAMRLARQAGSDRSGAVVAALAYGISPVPRNDLATGRLGPLILYALLPFLVLLLARAGRFDPDAPVGRRRLLGLAILTAVATAWYPPAALVVLVGAVAFLLAAPLVGGGAAAFRALGAALVGALGAAVLLFPWPVNAAHGLHDPAAFGFSFNPRLSLDQLIRFQTGPAGAGIATYGLLVAAAAALLLASGTRLAWAARAWMLVLVAWAAVEVPSRLAPGVAVPLPEAVLSLGALGLALAAGLAVASRPPRHLGLRGLCALVAMAGVILAGLGFAADSLDGRWHVPSNSWPAELAFTRDLQFEGQFRVLWVGDPTVLPLDPARVDNGVSYTLTRNGPGDARELLRAPLTHTRDPVADAVAAAIAGRTSRLGRILGPMGVRYVVLVHTNGPGGIAGRPVPALDAALRNQLDFGRLGSDPGIELYQNQAWYPGLTVVRGRQSTVPSTPADPARSAASVDLSGARLLGRRPARPGTVLWFEAFDSGWQAHAAGRRLTHRPAFATTNQFRLTTRAAVSISHTGQARRDLLIGVELILWILALLWWGRGRTRSSREPAAAEARAAARRARADRRRGFPDDLGSDIEFWEQV